jgi:hypothetical protein
VPLLFSGGKRKRSKVVYKLFIPPPGTHPTTFTVAFPNIILDTSVPSVVEMLYQGQWTAIDNVPADQRRNQARVRFWLKNTGNEYGTLSIAPGALPPGATISNIYGQSADRFTLQAGQSQEFILHLPPPKDGAMEDKGSIQVGYRGFQVPNRPKWLAVGGAALALWLLLRKG